MMTMLRLCDLTDIAGTFWRVAMQPAVYLNRYLDYQFEFVYLSYKQIKTTK